MLQEVILERWTQPSGLLCLWQCFIYKYLRMYHNIFKCAFNYMNFDTYIFGHSFVPFSHRVIFDMRIYLDNGSPKRFLNTIVSFFKGGIHTWYLLREPRVYPCKFFLVGVNLYRFNAKNWHFRQILREKVAFFFLQI